MTRTGIGWTTPSHRHLGEHWQDLLQPAHPIHDLHPNDGGLYGLVIADASSPTINLYFVDLKAEPCPAGRFAA